MPQKAPLCSKNLTLQTGSGLKYTGPGFTPCGGQVCTLCTHCMLYILTVLYTLYTLYVVHTVLYKRYTLFVVHTVLYRSPPPATVTTLLTRLDYRGATEGHLIILIIIIVIVIVVIIILLRSDPLLTSLPVDHHNGKHLGITSWSYIGISEAYVEIVVESRSRLTICSIYC